MSAFTGRNKNKGQARREARNYLFFKDIVNQSLNSEVTTQEELVSKFKELTKEKYGIEDSKTE